MDLQEFNAKPVRAGEPITAESWNELVNGIQTLNEFVRNSQSAALKVNLELGNHAELNPTAKVTAERRSDKLLVQAASPNDAEGEHVFAALPAGQYVVRVQLAGFELAQQEVEVPAQTELRIAPNESGAFMPNLVGVELTTALGQLKSASVNVSRVIDVVGRDIPPGNPGNEYRNSPVLMQLPDPGVAVESDGSVQLVIATALQTETRVEVPNLSGLTREEARRALEAIGLRLGDVDTLKAR